MIFLISEVHIFNIKKNWSYVEHLKLI